MFKFRKIASVLASTIMVSSTIALAAAANFPAPFVANGSANVAIVYGSAQVGGQDLVAAGDIQSTLQTQLAAQTATGSSSTSSTVSGGDFVKLEKASTKFQLGNGITNVVSATVTDSDLETLLADGVYLDDDNDEFDYTQKLTLSNSQVTMFEDNDYKADIPTIGMKIASGAAVLNYTLDFSDTPAWTDLSTTDLTIMGKTYYVLSTDAPTNTTMTLLDSASSIILEDGKTETITAGGKSYTVSISFISSTEVKLSVNGEVTNSLAEAQTYKLKDGSFIGIKDILYDSKEAGISKVEFSIGSGKLKIVNNSEVQINDNSVSGLKGYFTGSSLLSKVILEWTADDDLFVAPGSEAVMPGFGALKLTWGGMTYPAEEKITVKAGSDDYLVLDDFPLKDSTEDINILYGSNGVFQGIGKDSNNLLRTSNTTVLNFVGSTDDYFVASWTDGNDAESYLMRATNFDNTNSIDKTDFQYKKDGSWADAKTGARAGDTITLGNMDFTVGTVTYSTKTVNFTGSSSVSFNTLYTKEGLKVFLPYVGGNTSTSVGSINFSSGASGNTTSGHNSSSFDLTFVEEDKNEVIAGGRQFNVTLGWNTATTKQATISDIVGENATFTEIEETDKFESYIYSGLATKFIWDKSNTNQYSVDITYHGEESYANVFLAAPEASVVGSGGSTTLGNPIIKDSEVASAAGKNLIVVGGSCVNTVAAQLLGSSTPICGADFTTKTGVASGQFLIQTFDRTGGKVATLVAGYNAQDTTNAATYLRTNTVDTTVGKKYVGTSATSATLQTTTA